MASGSVIGALRVNLSLNTAAFSEGMKNAQSRLKSFGTQMTGVGQTLTKRLTVPIAAAATGMVASLGAISNSLADVQRQANLSNAGIEEFQRWAAGAKTVGIEQDKLSDILKDVNDRVGDFMATGGGPMADFFENIAPKVGVTAEQFAKLSGPEALQLYVSSLEKAGLSQQDMTFYMEAMASDATALIPLLKNNGEEMKRLGDRAEQLGIANAETVKKSQEFRSALDGLAAAAKGLGIALLESGIIEVLTRIVEKVSGFVSGLSEMDPRIVQAGAVFAALAAAIGPVLVAIGLLVTALGSLPIAATVALIAGLTAAVVAFWPEVIAAKDAVIAFGQEGLDWLRTKFEGLVEYLNALPGRFVQVGSDIIDGLLEGVQARLAAVKDTFTGLGDNISGWVKGKLGIQSPSRVFAEIGQNIMQGLSNGIDSLSGGVQSGMQSFAKDMASQFSSILQGATSWRDALRNILASAGGRLITAGVNGLFGAIGIPGFAAGTNSAPGGLALVGEKGPELVDLPAGSKVYNAARSADMLASGGNRSDLAINVNVSGARGNAEIEGMVSTGVMQGLAAYDQALPDKVNSINSDPRAR